MIRRWQFLAITCLIVLLVFAGLHIVELERRNQELIERLVYTTVVAEQIVLERQEWLAEQTEVEP